MDLETAPEALAEAHDNELVHGVPRWRWEEIGRKHAFDDDGVTEDEYAEDEPEDEEPEDE